MGNKSNAKKEEPDEFDPQRWGLCAEGVQDLGQRLHRVWERFGGCFKTRTHDTSDYAFQYLRGALTMNGERNYVNIMRRVGGPDQDGQALQQFMSDSPWSADRVYEQIQSELTAYPEIHGGMLTLDESGDEKAGETSAGAGRQYLGRVGKVDMGQVSVVAGYHAGTTWALVDAELYLPEQWFDEAHRDRRRRWHVPAERQHTTKQALGLQLIQRAHERGLPFRVIGCDSNYGRDSQFRAALHEQRLTYVADIPSDYVVYLARPVVGVPVTPPGHPGRPFTQARVLNEAAAGPRTVQQVGQRPDLAWDPCSIRVTERGPLVVSSALRRVWSVTATGEVLTEWLLLQREADGKLRYSLSNAPADTSRTQLARWQHQRYFAERIFQDAKSQAGWDEFQALKYRAWQHHTALDALAVWFIAQTKLDWARAHPPDPALRDHLQVQALPNLSFANVRELLQAVMPLPHLSPEEATRLVVSKLVKRSASTRSRTRHHLDTTVT